MEARALVRQGRGLWRSVLVAVLLTSFVLPTTAVARHEQGTQNAVSVFGQVTDESSGLPIEGAYVWTYYTDDSSLDQIEVGDTTDSEGRYELSLPAAGTYAVDVQADRYVSASANAAYNGTTPYELDFELTPRVLALQGTVRDADTDLPLGDASVQLEQGADTFLARTGTDGSYEVYVDPGVRTFTVSVSAPDYNEALGTLAFDGTNAETREYLLIRMGAISCYVTDSETDEPIENALITVSSPEMSVPIQRPTDAEGLCEILLPAGTYEVVAAIRGYEPRSYTVEHDGINEVSQHFELTRIPPAIVGIVTDARTGEPLPGVKVRLLYYEEAEDETGAWNELDSVLTNEEGAYGLIDVGGPADDDRRRFEASLAGYESHSHTFTVTDTMYTYDVKLVPESGEPLPPVLEVAGVDRYATAVEASELAFPHGAETVVIATGRNWPDALGGTALAGALRGPILLVTQSAVPDVTATEITRLGATKAVILGGDLAVGTQVASALQTAGLGVERIAGTSRYETADLVAARVIELLDVDYDGTAFVATGAKFPDALAAAPLAAAKGWPLFLAHPSAGLSDATRAAMSPVQSALILGGTEVVSETTESYLTTTHGDDNVTRLAGTSRYDTAALVAEHGVTSAGLSWDRVGITTGQKFPDALAGGVVQGKAGSVMLLTRSDSLESVTERTLSGNKSAIATVTYFGGDLAVSPAVRDAVRQALE